jgi:hypothetical protein
MEDEIKDAIIDAYIGLKRIGARESNGSPVTMQSAMMQHIMQDVCQEYATAQYTEHVRGLALAQ